MAINKTINKSTKSHGAMRNCIEYVTRVDKTRGELVEIIGPYELDSITYHGVYQSFLEEKRIWGKDSGRMYAHNIISWHEDEPITPEQALEFGKEFAEQWFARFQSLVGVHIDRNHVHCHIVTNSVSFMDGHKLHNTKKDLQRMKDFTNQMCLERGLSVAQKGRDFHGNELEQGTVSAWSKDKYHLMQNEAKDSFVADCGIACLDSLEISCSREDFIRQMAERGWSVAKKAKKAEQDMNQMEQNYSSQISRLKSEIQNLSDKIVKLNGADLVLKENEKLKRQNEELQTSEREAREEAEIEVAHVKSEYYRKKQELNRLIEETEQEKQKALSLQFVVQKLTDQKAKRLTEDTRRQWQVWYQVKRAAMQGYVGVLTIICLVTTVLSIIRQRVFCGDVIAFVQSLVKAIQTFSVHTNSVILSVAEVTEKVPNAVVSVVLKWAMWYCFGRCQ